MSISSLKVVLLALTVLLSMFPVILAGIPHEDEYIFAKVILYLGDLPALALTVLSVPLVLRSIRARPRPGIAALWAALIGIELLAFLVHPSVEGIQTLVRLGMAVAIIVTVASQRSPAERALLAGTLAVIAAVQAGIALAQIYHGGPLGLGMFGESPTFFGAGRHGQFVNPEGTMTHPHMLASLAVLAGTVLAAHLIRAARMPPWAVAEAVALAPAGFTYARTTLVGMALAGLALGVAAIRGGLRPRVALVALVLGFGVPALIGLDGWGAKTDDIAFANGRDELTAEGQILILANPLIGVGPGRQMQALRELQAQSPEKVTVFNAVHNVPLTVAIESGLPGLAIFVGLLGVAGWRAYRGGPPGLAIFGGYLPFVLLDHFPYSYQHGLVLTAVWLGAIELVATGEDP